MATLVLDDVSFRWMNAATPLFPAITAAIPPGTITTVMGENGCGKTTLLEIIGSRRPLSSGVVTVDGYPNVAEQFNYLPQDHTRLLFAHLTIGENITLQRTRRDGISDYAQEQALMKALFPDASALSRFPARCSGGQRQRASLCRAIREIPSFPVTLLDEPFSQLSHEAKVAILPAIIDHVRTSQNVAVVVTHDLLDAMLLGDSLLTLSAKEARFHDTSVVRGEGDFWKAVHLREDILRATHSPFSL